MRTTPVIFHSSKNTKSLRLKGEGFHPSQSETLIKALEVGEDSGFVEYFHPKQHLKELHRKHL